MRCFSSNRGERETPDFFGDVCVERVGGLVPLDVGCPSLSVACPQQKRVTATSTGEKKAFCFSVEAQHA